jgi:hypothetical protein
MVTAPLRPSIRPRFCRDDITTDTVVRCTPSICDISSWGIGASSDPACGGAAS